MTVVILSVNSCNPKPSALSGVEGVSEGSNDTDYEKNSNETIISDVGVVLRPCFARSAGDSQTLR